MVLTSFDYKVAYKEGRYNEIVDFWDSSELVPALEPATALIVAYSCYHLGDYHSCFDYLSSIESCYVDDIHFLSIFGSVSRRIGQLERASLYLNKAVELDPERASSRNNLANLFIDLKKYDSARSILNELISADPNYQDAIINLQRLDSIVESYQESSSDPSEDIDISFTIADPLLLAFAPKEVERSISILHGTQTKKVSDSASQLIKSLPVPESESTAQDQLKLAFKATTESNYELSLSICRSLTSRLEMDPSLYECAAEAYIGLKLFPNAEICLLHSIVLGNQSFKNFLNLSSLALIRGDKCLAEYYYSRASSLDSEDMRLSSLRASISSSSRAFKFPVQWSESYPSVLGSKRQ